MHFLGNLEESRRDVYDAASHNYVRGDSVLVFIGPERHDVLFLSGLERAETRSVGVGDEDIAALSDESEGSLLGSADVFPVADIRYDDLKVGLDTFGACLKRHERALQGGNFHSPDSASF